MCTALSVCTHTRILLALGEAGGKRRRGEGRALCSHSCATHSVNARGGCDWASKHQAAFGCGSATPASCARAGH